MITRCFLVVMVLLATSRLNSFAAPPANAEASPNQPVSFYRQVRPILQANCQGCHQPAKAKGGFVLTEHAKLLVAGESGKQPVVPGKPDESFLLAQILPNNGQAEMPKGKPPLPDSEVALIRRWIAEGGTDDTPLNAKQRYDAEHPPVYTRPPVLTSLEYSPDGKWIAMAGFHEVLLHRAEV